MASHLNKAPAQETNKNLASGLWEVQKRLDKIQGVPVTLGTRGHLDGGFPAQYAALKDPPIAQKARLYGNIQAGYAAATGNILPAQPQVVIPLDKSDVEAMEEKEKMSLQIDFDNWVGKQYDPYTDPAEAEWLQKIYPEYFEARVKENEALHDLQKQWAKIMISGPRSKEDLYLMFRVRSDPALDARLTQNAAGPIPATREANYNAGLLNRGKWTWRLPASGFNPQPAIGNPSSVEARAAVRGEAVRVDKNIPQLRASLVGPLRFT